jgi:hypothetical protein
MIMILHTRYTASNGDRVYLEFVDAINAYYKVGENLVVSSLKFFEQKYKLAR